MQYVKLVNRTDKVLHGVWDGKHVDIRPGAHQFPEQQAIAYKRQNPVMGSENPQTGDIVYKLGIEEHGDPVTPLGDFTEGVEKWDRSKLVGARPSEVVPGDNGLYSTLRGEGRSAPLPVDDGYLSGGR